MSALIERLLAGSHFVPDVVQSLMTCGRRHLSGADHRGQRALLEGLLSGAVLWWATLAGLDGDFFGSRTFDVAVLPLRLRRLGGYVSYKRRFHQKLLLAGSVAPGLSGNLIGANSKFTHWLPCPRPGAP
jgi:hypothetical protein